MSDDDNVLEFRGKPVVQDVEKIICEWCSALVKEPEAVQYAREFPGKRGEERFCSIKCRDYRAWMADPVVEAEWNLADDFWQR